jgi:hypothetical protein
MRPLSVTLLCWYLIIGNLVSCYNAYQDMNNLIYIEELQAHLPIPTALFFFINYVSAGILVTSGIVMLLGLSWGRTLWLYWSLLSIFFIAITLSFKMAILPIIGFCIFLYFIYHPKVDLFFYQTCRKTSSFKAGI